MTDILSTNDSLFTQNDMIMTDNGYYASIPMLQSVGGNKSYSGDKVSDNYKNLAIPALYLYTINGTCNNQNHIEELNDIEEPSQNEIMGTNEIMQNELMGTNEIMQNKLIDDDLYNKLILLAEMKEVINKKYTRHKKNIKKIKGRKTRRNK
jgi:hypothetical protein